MSDFVAEVEASYASYREQRDRELRPAIALAAEELFTKLVLSKRWMPKTKLVKKAETLLVMARQLSPKRGTVEDGYRFFGGDPAERRNWRPLGL